MEGVFRLHAQVMIDRFFDADPRNNDGSAAGAGASVFISPTARAFDPASHNRRNGGDLSGVAAQLPYIRSAGFGTVWLSPIFLSADLTPFSASYHGYYNVDFTVIDPRLVHMRARSDSKSHRTCLPLCDAHVHAGNC